jgi:dTDP-4-amino-4,6-dideoxygalactose transaminase
MKILNANPGRMRPEESIAVKEAISKVIQKGIFVGGEFLDKFEENFAMFHGNNFHCVGVGNGLDALIIALETLELPPNSKVLVPSNDGGFAALAVQTVGLFAIPLDVSPTTGLVDFEDLERSWQEEVSALIITHLHGFVVEARKFKNWCAEKNIFLIEDCSQAHGANDGVTKVGATGDISTYSFYPTKNLGALGDGGALVTCNPTIAKKARQLRSYGWEDKYQVKIKKGRNSRLDSLQAAILSSKLPFLHENNEARRRIINRYNEEIRGAKFLGSPQIYTVGHHAVLLSNHRDNLSAELAKNGIITQIHYPYLIQEMPGLSKIAKRETPYAKFLAARKLSLPCFPSINESEISKIIEHVNKTLKKYSTYI